jgi:hypothetical protein
MLLYGCKNNKMDSKRLLLPWSLLSLNNFFALRDSIYSSPHRAYVAWSMHTTACYWLGTFARRTCRRGMNYRNQLLTYKVHSQL